MTPFSVLHVCMGNICRSPMAERLFLVALSDQQELVYSHSAGTGGWHAGESMNPAASRQVLARGGDVTGFAARKLDSGLIEGSDLVLTATVDQYDRVLELRPDAAGRTFVLGEWGRLQLSHAGPLPPFDGDAKSLYERAVGLVEALDAARAGARPRPSDDLDDPWGLGEMTFARVADEIELTLRPLADVIVNRAS
ncbi:MAG: phosphotyrosine protein phosphatase [Longispora sp.]|nr:phosphotyrosine protein phosphatase [Longispora sp. (in: high G+C Gram-positive bacteria)]